MNPSLNFFLLSKISPNFTLINFQKEKDVINSKFIDHYINIYKQFNKKCCIVLKNVEESKTNCLVLQLFRTNSSSNNFR